MKAFKIVLLAGLVGLPLARLVAQENTIAFTYDKSGKMTQRQVQVMQGARIGHFGQEADSMRRNFNVFPNPTNNYINIEGELPEHVNQAAILLMNTNGQLLRTDVYNGKSKQLHVADLSPGLYLLEIQYSKKKKDVYKIIITN